MAAHGTHVASMIFGQAGGPVAGIAPGSSGLMAPIYSDSDEQATSQADLGDAILRAVEAKTAF